MEIKPAQSLVGEGVGDRHVCSVLQQCNRAQAFVWQCPSKQVQALHPRWKWGEDAPLEVNPFKIETKFSRKIDLGSYLEKQQ